MVTVTKKYAGESRCTPGELGLSTNETRPVRFHGRVSKDVFPLRRALQALGKLVWSDYQWLSDEEYDRMMELILDPVITVHDDRVFFEAFNQDQSAYGLVIADRDIFETAGDVAPGTTNIDFTETLYASLAEMSSVGDTWFRVGPTGFAVETEDTLHVEEKVELPIPWVRGFLQLQAAMALPGTRLELRPVDLLTIIRWIRHNRAEHSPRSLRFEFEPGLNAKVVLEPWEKEIDLKTSHNYTRPKTTRIWGRRKLELLEPILPYADSVTLYLKGRALPSFWVVEISGVSFVLGMSGWTGANWTQAGSFDLMNPTSCDEGTISKTLAHLKSNQAADDQEVASAAGISSDAAFASLSELCRRGRALYDVESRQFRHRELFAEPIDLDKYYPPEPRTLEALELESSAEVTKDELDLTLKSGSAFVDRVVEGTVSGENVHFVEKDTGQLIFGQCTCAFFQENLMARGPCSHMLALRAVANRTKEQG